MKTQFIFILLFISFSISIYGQNNSIAGAYTVKQIKGTVEYFKENPSYPLFIDTLSFVFMDSEMATYSVSKNDSIRKYKAYKEGTLIINNDNTFIGYLTINLDRLSIAKKHIIFNPWNFPNIIIKGAGKIGVSDKHVILCYENKHHCILFERRGNQLIQKNGETRKVVLTKEQ